MSNEVTFNDIHCTAIGIEVMDSRRPLLAETKDEYIEMPYRDGSIHIPDKSLKDINVEIDFLLNPIPGKTVHDACRDIAAWLHTDDRKKLIFDNDPNFYYLAKPVGQIDKEQIINFAEFKVIFRCHPVMKAVGT